MAVNEAGVGRDESQWHDESENVLWFELAYSSPLSSRWEVNSVVQRTLLYSELAHNAAMVAVLRSILDCLRSSMWLNTWSSIYLIPTSKYLSMGPKISCVSSFEFYESMWFDGVVEMSALTRTACQAKCNETDKCCENQCVLCCAMFILRLRLSNEDEDVDEAASNCRVSSATAGLALLYLAQTMASRSWVPPSLTLVQQCSAEIA